MEIVLVLSVVVAFIGIFLGWFVKAYKDKVITWDEIKELLDKIMTNEELKQKTRELLKTLEEEDRRKSEMGSL